MKEAAILKGKRILVVDDEPDVLETLKGLLEDCAVDTAQGLVKASELIEKNDYDAAILDIMGVQGYDLLAVTTGKNIPTLMLTAHALSPGHLIRSVKRGALAYLPKDKIREIRFFLAHTLEAHEKGEAGLGDWYTTLESFFDKKFGERWKEKSDPASWKTTGKTPRKDSGE